MSSALSKPSRASHPRAEQWAERICTQLGKSVESIIEVGHLLVKAKADLVHGEWGRLFDGKLLPFGQRTAHMLMTVATHPQISNRKQYSDLPPSWTSLYELTKVEPTRLSAAFKDGIITPDMKRSDVKALLPPSQRRIATPVETVTQPVERIDDSPHEEEEEEERFHVDLEVLRVIHIIRSVAAGWPDSVSLEPLIVKLRYEADRLERRQERHAS